MTDAASAGQVASLFSPYEMNPLGVDPLRTLLEAHIDFAAVRDHGPIGLLIAVVLVKVVLIDLAGVSGIWRALSFLCVGAVLVGIGRVYQRLILVSFWRLIR